ncbi:MAG: dihydrodipicolinate reductase [Pseudomonadota bacterium]
MTSTAPVSDIRAVVFGVGAMGALATRLLSERGVSIVGALGRSPEKVGRDLGDVADLGYQLGVQVEADADIVLGRGADIAVVCVGSYLDNMHRHFEACLGHGLNVITIEEETVFPWRTAPALSKKLDALAKANGTTLAASGAQDVFWVNLVSTLLGASHRVDSVIGECRWNVDDYGPEVAGHLRLGQTAESFHRFVAQEGWPEFVARQTLEALISKLDLSPDHISSGVEPVVARQPVQCRSLGSGIAAGQVMGTIDTTKVSTVEGPTFEFRMEGRVYTPGETDKNHWRILGEPDLQLSNDVVPYRFTTCSTLINRIPDVIRAAPGLLSLDLLGPPQYRHALAKAR